jgi:hypothetical protein
MEEKKKTVILNINRTEIYIFLGVGFLLFILPLIFTSVNISLISFRETGQIGDTIGGITAPFIGFGGSILVYLALKAQIDANDKIQKQFDEQKKIDYRQNFENIFFNMLTIHHDIVKNIDFNTVEIIENDSELEKYSKDYLKELYSKISTNKPLASRDVFKFSLEVLKRLIKEDLVLEHQLNRPNEEDAILLGAYDYSLRSKFNLFKEIFAKKEIHFLSQTTATRYQSIYDSVYFKLNTDFGHYFRNVYRIIKMVDEKKFSENPIEDFKIKYSYTSIVRAQLCDDEIIWLFFNCLSNKGSKKFKPLLEKYSILKIINIDDNVYNFYTKFYENSAFKKPNDENLEDHLKKFNK